MKKDEKIFTTEEIHVIANLVNSHCELNHGPGIDNKDFPAVNTIIVPIGYKENDVSSVSVRNLYIPICQECQDSIGNGWVLLYCLECCANHWVSLEKAKLNYFNQLTGENHDIIFLKGCPECSGKFGGFYCEKD